jgi:hypothetical protein
LLNLTKRKRQQRLQSLLQEIATRRECKNNPRN